MGTYQENVTGQWLALEQILMTLIANEMFECSPGPIVLVKDTLDVAGYPTRFETRAFADALPAKKDFTVVALFRRGAWCISAKTKLHELAFGTTGLNLHDGSPPTLVPGGSSSFATLAIASGLAELAIGTDTGGSIRVPAGCCGVIGFKPTFGLVTCDSKYPLGNTLDCIGPFALNLLVIFKGMCTIGTGFRPESLSGPFRLGVMDVKASEVVQRAVRNARPDGGGDFSLEK